MAAEITIWKDDFDLALAIHRTRERGYSYIDDVLDDEMRAALEGESQALPLELGDHVKRPLNQGRANEVRQRHERFYVAYGDSRTPAANLAVWGITRLVRSAVDTGEFDNWQLSEIGYQRYRQGDDFIGPHRDRSSDNMLSATLTLTGQARMAIYEPRGDRLDYSRLKKIDEFTAIRGGLMLLRAPGFGTGEQVIHQVFPPEQGERVILNLRARTTILRQPAQDTLE